MSTLLGVILSIKPVFNPLQVNSELVYQGIGHGREADMSSRASIELLAEQVLPPREKTEAEKILAILRPGHALQGLTGPQEQFAYALFTGSSQADAYRHAHNCEHCAPETVQHMASMAARNPKVVARVRQLQMQRDERASLDHLISREEIARGLAEIAFNPVEKSADRIRALTALGNIGGIELFKPKGKQDDEPADMTVAEIESRLATALGKIKDITPR